MLYFAGIQNIELHGLIYDQMVMRAIAESDEHDWVDIRAVLGPRRYSQVGDLNCTRREPKRALTAVFCEPHMVSRPRTRPRPGARSQLNSSCLRRHCGGGQHSTGVDDAGVWQNFTSAPLRHVMLTEQLGGQNNVSFGCRAEFQNY